MDVGVRANWEGVCACSVLSDSATAARQAPLSKGFSRKEHLSGLPCPPQGIVPSQDSGIKPTSPVAPARAGGLLSTEPPGSPWGCGCLANPSLCCAAGRTSDGFSSSRVKSQPTYQPTECVGATDYGGMGSHAISKGSNLRWRLHACALKGGVCPGGGEPRAWTGPPGPPQGPEQTRREPPFCWHFLLGRGLVWGALTPCGLSERVLSSPPPSHLWCI